KLDDGRVFDGLDLRVEIDEVPAEAVGKHARDGCFAGSHESRKINTGRALEVVMHRQTRSIRDSTRPGKSRFAQTRSQPSAGVTTICLRCAIPSTIAAAQSVADTANFFPATIRSGGGGPAACAWKPVST